MSFLNASSLIYRYLLGELTPTEQLEVEERLTTDDDYRKQFQAAEHRLIAAYVSGYLTVTEDKRDRWKKYLLRSAESIEKLKVAKLLYEARTSVNGCPNTSDPIYRYFFGELTPAEQLEVEERLVIDNEYKERFQAAERTLIVAYTLEDSTGNHRKIAQPYFFGSEERLAKLKFAEDIYQYYQDDEPVEAREGAGSRWLDRLRQWVVEPISLSVGHWDVSRPVWQPLATLSVVILGALVWALFFYQSAVTRGLNLLHAAYAQERPVEARLTGFGYGAYRARQNSEVVKFYKDERDDAFLLILRQVDEEKSAAAYHALGQIYLAYNDPNEAAHRFELALQQNPNDARLRNDLAVALMEREKEKAKKPGQSTGEDTALALEHLHRAVELDSSLLEAHFNLALCHQYQMLWRLAKEDWEKYLAKDSMSPWAEEARGNLTKVTEKIKQAGGNRENIYQNFLVAYQQRDVEQAWEAYKKSRVGTGSFITNRLIDDYLSLALSGKSAEAEDKLSALLFIGNIELEKVGDRFTHDLTQFYRGASPQQLRKLSAARDLTKVANERLRQSRVGEAINNYRRAIELFDQAGDACESLIARRWLGHCYFQQTNPSLSLPVLTQGHQECETSGYLWLLGMFLNDMANVNIDLARYSKALDYGLSQVSYAKRVEDDSGIVLGINKVTGTYLLLARYQETLPMIQEGLSVAGMINADPGQIVGLYAMASKCHMASGKPLAALEL